MFDLYLAKLSSLEHNPWLSPGEKYASLLIMFLVSLINCHYAVFLSLHSHKLVFCKVQLGKACDTSVGQRSQY